jgi:hypothetical protein
MAATDIPETMTLNLSLSIYREDLVELFDQLGEELTLDAAIDKLRERAYYTFATTHAISSAKITDQNGVELS